MNRFGSLVVMILYAVILLLVAKPLDNWREARLNKRNQRRANKQRELFDSSNVDKDRPLLADHR